MQGPGRGREKVWEGAWCWMEDIVETSSGLMWARPSAASHSSGGHAHLSGAGTPSYSNPGSESRLSWGELINTYLCIRPKGTTHVTSTEPHIHLGEPTSGFPHFTWPLHFMCQNQKNRHQSHCLSLSACLLDLQGSLEVNLQPAPYWSLQDTPRVSV